MPNTRNRANIKALIDLLSDGHTEITSEANKVNEQLLLGDEKETERAGAGKLSFKHAARLLDALELRLENQEQRVSRVRSELATIRGNLRIS